MGACGAKDNLELPQPDPRPVQEKTVFLGEFDDEVRAFLDSFPPMDKDTMGGRCVLETQRMTNFMKNSFQFENIKGETFADGVRAFKLGVSIEDLEENQTVAFEDEERLYIGDRVRIEQHGEGFIYLTHPGGVIGVKFDDGREFPRISRWAVTVLERIPRTIEQADVPKFTMSKSEILQWQQSFRAFYDEKVIRQILSEEEDIDDYILELLSGNSARSWAAKFCVRVSQAPMLCLFDSKIIHREPSLDDWAHNIFIVSQPGVDFAGRKHDVEDIHRYVSNWKSLYKLEEDGSLVIVNGRDFINLKGQTASLNEDILTHDLEQMASLRLKACDEMGVQFVCETAIGCGVFAGDAIGIGHRVRTLVATSVRRVLERTSFTNIQCVVFALPIFGKVEYSNYQRFIDAFEGYSGKIPVCFMDNSAHIIAFECAKRGFKTSELNPADSHCVFGEYWQNMGPGTEEKFALTTAGLLTQHHAINPSVLNKAYYKALA